MRRTALIALALVFSAGLADAAWKKAYFAATTPGSWVRYADQTAGENASSMTSTYRRLANDNGRARIELLTEFGNDQYPASTNLYTLRKDFDLDHQLIDLGKGLAAVGAGMQGHVSDLPPATVALMRKGMPEYGVSAAFREVKTFDGRTCDQYTYSIHHEPGHTETGELCLSDRVPFGVVRQTSTTKDANGKVLYTYERQLQAEGHGPASAGSSTVMASAPAKPKRGVHTLKEAFDQGLIGISATVDPSVKNGEKVRLLIESKSDVGLTLKVPKGPTSLHVDIPLDDFVFDVAAAQTFELTGDHPARLVVRQTGKKRAFDGAFKISVYEGTPLFSGSATVGWVK